MAAQTLTERGLSVDLFDRMPSPGRKFLIAGKGGLNLTHSEPFPDFLKKYGVRETWLAPYLSNFGPSHVREWAKNLGTETFIGTSGRVFPVGMKAAPLLFAWKDRLRSAGVGFYYKTQFTGFGEDGSLVFQQDGSILKRKYRAVIFALGGASWGTTGSKGDWVPEFERMGIVLAPFKPANCGFDVPWSTIFKEKYDGKPLKSVTVALIEPDGLILQKRGEFIVTSDGIEGSLIYALSSRIRNSIEQNGRTDLYLDLLPDTPRSTLIDQLSKYRGKKTISNFLEKATGLRGVKLGLLYEFIQRDDLIHPLKCAQAIKALPIPITSPHPLDEAISSAGGVRFEELTDELMVRRLPGVFCAGEMLDWEAPTGGYLITACLATGVAAANGAARWLNSQ